METSEVSTETFDLDVQIEELTKKLDSNDYNSQYATLKQKGATTKKQAETLKTNYEALREKKINFEADYNGLKKSLETVDGLKGCCIVDPQRISCSKDFVQFKEFVTQTSAEAEKYLLRLQTEMDAALGQYRLVEKELLTIQTEMEAVLEKSRKANEANKQFNDQIAKLKEQRNERLNAKTNRDNQIKFYQNELAQLNSQALAAPQTIDNLELLEAEARTIETKLEGLKTTIEAKEKTKRDLVLIQQSMLENRQAEYKAACLKSISEELGPKGIQGEIVKGALGPLKDNMQQYLSMMGINHEIFFETESETGQEIFEFGWILGQRKVYFDSLSNGEKIIYLAALMTVIVDRANPKTRILAIDNLDNLDKYNFKLVIHGLSKLKAKFDNIILAGVVQGDQVFPGKWETLSRFFVDEFTVWNLTPEVAADEQHIA